jgi:hypothetical protein
MGSSCSVTTWIGHQASNLHLASQPWKTVGS